MIKSYKPFIVLCLLVTAPSNVDRQDDYIINTNTEISIKELKPIYRYLRS